MLIFITIFMRNSKNKLNTKNRSLIAGAPLCRKRHLGAPPFKRALPRPFKILILSSLYIPFCCFTCLIQLFSITDRFKKSVLSIFASFLFMPNTNMLRGYSLKKSPLNIEMLKIMKALKEQFKMTKEIQKIGGVNIKIQFIMN